MEPVPVPDVGAAQVTVAATLFTLDSASLAGIPVSLRTSAGVFGTTTVNSSGSFALSGIAVGDSVDLVVDGRGRGYLPALLRFERGAVPPTLRILLVPRSWTIDSGTYARSTVTFSPNLAFTPPCASTSDTNCDGFYPAAWFSGIKLWENSAFPIPLAFDHARSSATISDADSVAFWAAVRKMELDLGQPLFRPARIEELAVASDGWSSGAVIVRIDATLASNAAYTNWRWNASGMVYAGTVRFGSAGGMRMSGLVTHELLHTQGFKHTCGWSTVMGGYGCAMAAGLTREDVAYAQLARRLRDSEALSAAPHAIMAALQGERVLMLDLPPLPSAAMVRAQRLALRGEHQGTDGAH